MIKYLAIPYSHDNEEVREIRFEIANAVSALLMKKGEVIFSPISHTHPMVKYGLPGDWAYWEEQDTHFLNVCGAFYAVMLKGWDVSTGVTAEISYMVEQRGIQINYINPYELEDDVIRKMATKHDKLLKGVITDE
jgi:hypothetical protein